MLSRTFLAVTMLLCGLAGAMAAERTQEQDRERARTAVQALAGALQAELAMALGEGGTKQAIATCNAEALPLTQEIAEQQNLNIRRVSNGFRNPGNRPEAWQGEVLASFEQRRAQGEDPMRLEWSETVETGGAREFRYMKAIPTGQVCLQCHGSNIEPGTQEVLARHYPDDRATGYAEGELRGAFVVTWDAE